MNQRQQYTTVGEYFKTSKILFGAFIIGVINLGIVLVILFFLEMLPLGDFDPSLTIYAIIGSLIFFALMTYVGNVVVQRKASQTEQHSALAKKLSVYREGKLIQAVTLEASALVAMVLTMFLTHIFFVVIAFLSLMQMIRSFPKKSEIVEAFELSYSDQQKLDDPNFKLS